MSDLDQIYLRAFGLHAAARLQPKQPVPSDGSLTVRHALPLRTERRTILVRVTSEDVNGAVGFVDCDGGSDELSAWTKDQVVSRPVRRGAAYAEPAAWLVVVAARAGARAAATVQTEVLVLGRQRPREQIAQNPRERFELFPDPLPPAATGALELTATVD